MTFSWTLLIDLGLIAFALLIATVIRAKVPFFQKYLIPNAITAGFILLPVLQLHRPRLGLGTGGLENLVFHLLNISFISMSLKAGSMKGAGKRVFATAVSVISHYTIQVVIGLGITAAVHRDDQAGPVPQLRVLPPPRLRPRPRAGVRHRQAVGVRGVRQRGQPRPDLRRHGIPLGRASAGVWLINFGLRKGVARQGRPRCHRQEEPADRHLRTGREGPGRRAPAHRHRGHRLDVLPPRARVRRCT